jgi:hypothetical protein
MTVSCDDFPGLTYDPETGEFLRDQKPCGTVTKRGYRVIYFAKRFHYAHRLAWRFMTGEWPADQVDHVDSNRGDNRFANLRAATVTQNNRNRRHVGAGLKGAQWHSRRQKFQSQIRHDGQLIWLGYFDTAEQAHAAYAVAAERLHGEFARIA